MNCVGIKILIVSFVLAVNAAFVLAQDFNNDTSTSLEPLDDVSAILPKEDESIADKALKKDNQMLHKNGYFLGLEFDFDKKRNLGFLTGNQTYFGKNQAHGVKVSTNINIYNLEQDETKPSLMSWGFDIKYLWDFLRVKNFVVGLNAGLGYQKYFFLNLNPNKVQISNFGKKYIENFENDFVMVVGVHIYYSIFQFEILSGYPNLLRGTISYRF